MKVDTCVELDMISVVLVWNEIVKWCNNCVGEQGIKWQYEERVNICRFYFNDASDSTMFILKWGKAKL